MNYILIVDDEADIRDIYEVVLKRAFPLDIVLAESGKSALRIIQEKGNPEVVISDLKMPDGDGHFLYSSLLEMNINVPFIICSTDSERILKSKFPKAFGFIEKPNIIGPLVEQVTSIVARHKDPPSFIPLRISLLLRWGTTNFDLYMKLSESKFIKVINAGEAFIPSDAERFFKKYLEHLFITTSDADLYLADLERNLTMLMSSAKSEPQDLTSLTLASIESVERVAFALGWTPQVLEVAKHAVNLAIKAVAAEPNILKLMKQKLSNPASNYSAHVSMLSLLTCGFCYKLGWTSESTQMKLGLAALMHDLTVEEDVYRDVKLWNQAAMDINHKNAETLKYRSHPADAANLLLSMKNVPADVDQIILQHHELKDGTGFPRGLISSRISPMASLFIIVEDLITFLEGSEDLVGRVSMFLKHRESLYNSGNFKKVFEAFKDSVQKSRL